MGKPNWNAIAINLPTLIGVAMHTVEALKKKGPTGEGPTGPEKEAAVIAGVKAGLPPFEAIAGDVVNDTSFDQLLSAYIQARVALMNFMTAHPPVLPA